MIYFIVQLKKAFKQYTKTKIAKNIFSNIVLNITFCKNHYTNVLEINYITTHKFVFTFFTQQNDYQDINFDYFLTP